jgi:TldD protein
LTEALTHSDADYCEIRFETEDATSLKMRGPEVESTNASSFAGGVVRACRKGGWGVCIFDSLAKLESTVREACRNAALVGNESTELADVPPVVREQRADFKTDFRGVPLDDKLKLIQGYNRQVLGFDERIESSLVVYGDTFRTVHFADSRGTWFLEERPKIVCVVAAMARKGDLIQRGFESFATPDDFSLVLGFEEKTQAAAKRAVDLLSAPKCESGPHTVILNQAMGGVFIHEAFGHLSEADSIYENPKLKEQMAIGRKMGVDELNVVDDGTHDWTTGSLGCDDEGTPASKNYLIREGVLSSHLHSLETAAKMGARPTGNARAVRRDFPPIVRMTNTYVEPGSPTREELFAGVDDGIYACNAFGGQTMMEMFTFSSAYAYRIENGQPGELVRDVVLTGNVFETLNAIDGIADDLIVHDTAGGCGKGGQAPLPVGFGSPHIRIQDVVIGGK